MATRLHFDSKRFYADVASVAKSRGLSMWRLGVEVGFHHSTMSKVKAGAAPGGVLLAALCRWAGLDAGDYSIDREPS